MAEHVHSIDAHKAWVDGWDGQLARYRFLAVGIGKFGFSSVMTYLKIWPSLFLPLALISGTYVVAAIYWRKHLIGLIESDNRFHNFCHHTRDDVSTIVRNPNVAGATLSQFATHSAQRIADYFRTRMNDDQIGCCIRLSENSREQGQVYVTRGRSEGYDAARKAGSEPIPADEGIANALRKKQTQGVIIINDVRNASKNDLSWYRTKNDELEDVQCVMVAPINCWEEGTKSMIGMLCVTSHGRKFRGRHAIPLKSFADTLGLVFPILVQHINRVEGEGA